MSFSDARPPRGTSGHDEAAAWVSRVDLDAVDRRFGAAEVDRVLSDPRAATYAVVPRVDVAGRLVASFVLDGPAGAPSDRGRAADHGAAIEVKVRISGDEIELSCPCSTRRALVCDHVKRILVDVALDDALRAALVGGAADEAIAALVDRLPSCRSEAFEERTLDARLARWLPPRGFDEDFEIDVDVSRSAGLASTDVRPALFLRHRRPGARALLRARDVLDARLAPWHRRIVELTSPSHMDRNALVSARAQASVLLHLLREDRAAMARPIHTRAWKSRVRFALEPVAPSLEALGGRLVARWTTPNGDEVANADEALVFAGPYPFLWSERREVFYPIVENVDLDLAIGLSVVPSLPLTARSAQKIGRALLTRGRSLGVALPPPSTFGLAPLEAPSFELRVAGTPLELRAELYSVYNAFKAPVLPASPGDDAGRNPELEERALAVFRGAGFDFDDDGVLVASEERAVEFWRRGVAALRALEDPRIQVFVSESLRRVRVGPPLDIRVHTSARSGWLDTRLELSAGAVAVEMHRVAAALSSGSRFVVLADGALSHIRDDVAALVDEGSSLLGREGRARLPAHQLGRVERWLERYGGEFDDSVATLRGRLRALSVPGLVEPPRGLRATLRPYQLHGVAWLAFLAELGAGGILADDMGLGKTIMTLAFLAREKETRGDAPSLVVCPTSVVPGWAREAARFVPDMKVLVATRKRDTRDLARVASHDLVVVTYGALRRDVDWLARVRFRSVVLDEAQNIKNPSAMTSRAARRLDASMRVALSGTPIENRLGELWAIMSFVNPGMLGTRADFEERFENPIAPRADAARNEPVAAQLRAIVRPFVLRRTKAEVLPELPPKTEVDVDCVLGLPQRRMYEALARTVRAAVKSSIRKRGLARSRISVLTAILRLRQMAVDPRLVDPEALAKDSAKRTMFLDLVRQLIAEGRRALVFSQFVELLSLWRADLDAERVPYEYLDGRSTKRDEIVDRFQRGSAPLFLVSLKAGGAGLNLTGADTVIHCDPWWNPAVEDQATDRAHRIGQTRAVTVIRLVARGTIEDKIRALSTKKRELGTALLGDERSALGAVSDLTEEDVERLLGSFEDVGMSDDASRSPPAPTSFGRSDSRDAQPTRRYVPVGEVDELRAILRRVEASGTLRKDLARKAGIPLARLSLLLIGHPVPVPTKTAMRIRALA